MTKEEKIIELNIEYEEIKNTSDIYFTSDLNIRLIVVTELIYLLKFGTHEDLTPNELLEFLPDYIEDDGEVNRIQLNKENSLWVLQYINEDGYAYTHHHNRHHSNWKDAIFKCKTIKECCLQMIEYINECELW